MFNQGASGLALLLSGTSVTVDCSGCHGHVSVANGSQVVLFRSVDKQRGCNINERGCL